MDTTKVDFLVKELSELKLLFSTLENKHKVLENKHILLTKEHDLVLNENNKLREEIKQLKSKLNTNSRNSHKPPSMDSFNKIIKRSNSVNELDKKLQGGQIGHKGKSLEFSSSPDYQEFILPEICSCCGKSLLGEEVIEYRERRQVYDLPKEIKLEVSEYRTGKVKCQCGNQEWGKYPTGVESQLQYGMSIRALITSLSVKHRMPLKQIKSLLGDLFFCDINESTIVKATKECYTNIQKSLEVIKEKTITSSVVHADETSIRVNKTNAWVHVVSNEKFTYMFAHKKRGKEAIESDQSILKEITGFLVHDCWVSYFDLSNCKHVICNAHILRELEKAKEDNSLWAVEMQNLLMNLYKKTEKGTSILSKTEAKEWGEQYDLICQRGEIEEPIAVKSPNCRGRPKKTKSRNLLERMQRHKESILLFVSVKVVPFTNNQAERDLRKIKVKQKISTSFRSQLGADIYLAIESFLSTLQKHGINCYEELKKVFSQKEYCWTC